VLASAFAVAAMVAAPGAATAAQPAAGALYLLPLQGDLHLPREVGTLRVADDGKAITSKGDIPFSVWEDGVSASYLAFTPHCGRVRERVFFALGAPGYARIPIRPDGTFSARAPGASDWYPHQDGWGASIATLGGKLSWIRIRGAFTARGAVVRIVSGRFNSRFADRRHSCRIPPRSFRFVRQRVPRFAGCRDPGFKTLASTATSRIFSAPATREFGRAPTAYGCVDGEPPVALADMSVGYTGFGAIAPETPILLAGPYAAYIEAFDPDAGDAAGIDFYLVVVDLRPPGHAIRDLVPVPDINKLGTAEAPTFGDVVLTAAGSVAWIGGYCASGFQTYGNESGDCVAPDAKYGYEVWIADAAGLRRVDSGADIKSLTLAEGSVSWVNGATSRSAAIDSG